MKEMRQRAKPSFAESRRLQERSHAIIPGGSHTYAKGDDQFPEQTPGFIARGKGCHVWDADGNEFIEYGMGLRSVTLGHAFEPVVEAAHRQMLLGVNFSRPAKIEVDLAEAMLGLIDGADMVKFAKNGSDVTTAAVKLARAYTGRNLIAICGDQPFFSTDDWFIGSTEMNAGIPQAIVDMTLKFRYNDIENLKDLFDQHPDQIACVVMEAEAATPPVPGYLAQVKELCESRGAVLIFDEMITGFRWHLGGAQKFHGVTPHLSTFGKAMANGFALAALMGKREIMQLGGLEHDQPRVFLLSTTHGRRKRTHWQHRLKPSRLIASGTWSSFSGNRGNGSATASTVRLPKIGSRDFSSSSDSLAISCSKPAIRTAAGRSRFAHCSCRN